MPHLPKSSSQYPSVIAGAAAHFVEDFVAAVHDDRVIEEVVRRVSRRVVVVHFAAHDQAAEYPCP